MNDLIQSLKKKLTGNALDETLREKRISKSKLSKLALISHQALVNWKNETVVPSDDALLRVASALGMIRNDARVRELVRTIMEAQDELARYQFGKEDRTKRESKKRSS